MRRVLAMTAAVLALAAAGAAAAFDKPRWKDPTQPDLFPKNFGYKDPHPPLFPKNFGYKEPKPERYRPEKPIDYGSDRSYTQRTPRGKDTPGDKWEPLGGGKWNDRVR